MASGFMPNGKRVKRRDDLLLTPKYLFARVYCSGCWPTSLQNCNEVTQFIAHTFLDCIKKASITPLGAWLRAWAKKLSKSHLLNPAEFHALIFIYFCVSEHARNSRESPLFALSNRSSWWCPQFQVLASASSTREREVSSDKWILIGYFSGRALR